MQLLSISDAMSRYEGNTLRSIAENMAQGGEYKTIWLIRNEADEASPSEGYTHFFCSTEADATGDVVAFLLKPSVSNDTRMYGEGKIVAPINVEELDLVIIPKASASAEEPATASAESEARTPSVAPSWYFADSKSKHVRQVVITLPGHARVPPRVSNLMAGSAFIEANWATTLLQMVGNAAQLEGPFVFAKTTGLIDLVKDQAVIVACAFYRMDRGGVVQIFVEVDSPQIRSAAGGSPYIAEYSLWLDEEDDRGLVDKLVGLDDLEVCFVAPGDNGPCTGYFGLRVELPEEIRSVLRHEWDELQAFHRGVSNRDFRASLDQYNGENPMSESPILKPSQAPVEEPQSREGRRQDAKWWEFWK